MNRTETLMNRDRFKKIMETLIEFKHKRTKVSDFLQEEVATGSWVFVTYGEEIESALVNMLADEFDCWFDTGFCGDPLPKEWWSEKPHQENDIAYWLYELSESDIQKSVTINGTEVPLETLDEFYDYLVKYCLNEQ